MLYFNGPIAVMLFLNLVGSAMIIHKLCAKDKLMRLNVRDPKKRTNHEERQDQVVCFRPSKITGLFYRLVQYLKIFIGMGLTWIFEVLSAALDKHTPEEAW